MNISNDEKAKKAFAEAVAEYWYVCFEEAQADAPEKAKKNEITKAVFASMYANTFVMNAVQEIVASCTNTVAASLDEASA